MWKNLGAAAVFLSVVTSAHAAPIYTTSVTVGYDPSAQTSNFGNPGTTNNETAYVVRTGIDSSNFYVDVTATPQTGQKPDRFSNIYFGGLKFSPGLIFEVGNDRVSTTSNPSNYYSLAGTGFVASVNYNDISFTLPLSFLETDPLGIGFTEVTAGDEIRVSYSQSFGYSFVGGTGNYGQARLGEQFVPAETDVPEPATAGILLVGVLATLGAARRNRQRGRAR